MLDQCFQVPLATALSQLVLSDEMAQALAAHEGPYARYLELALACEGHDVGRMEVLARACNVAPDGLAELQLQALMWAQQDQAAAAE